VEEDSKGSQAQQWAKQIERNIDRPGASSAPSNRRHGGGSSSSGLGSQYVEVVRGSAGFRLGLARVPSTLLHR
jgi:hypothetical protein